MNTKIMLLGLMLSLSGVALTQAPDDEAMNASEVAADLQLLQRLSTEPEWLQQAFKDNHYQTHWSTAGAANQEFDNLIKHIESAPRIGLKSEDYQLDVLKGLADAPEMEREVLATKWFAEFMHDVIDGKSTPLIELPDDFDELHQKNRTELLDEAFKYNHPFDYLDKHIKDNFVTRRLINALERYRAMEANGGWEPITFNDKKVEVGDEHAIVPALRKRMAAERFLNGDAANDKSLVYDAGLEEAVKNFQKSRVLHVDGVIGPQTVEHLNVPVTDLIEKLVINIERARWLPHHLGDRFLFVDIADYQLNLMEGETLVDKINVIVGKHWTKTPVFGKTLKTVVINPYWNIPQSIVKHELAKKMQKDPSHIKNKNMEVLNGWGHDAKVIDETTVDWAAVQAGKVTVRARQKPGKDNALGLIKFLFPNRFNVYLHDTPNHTLFDRDDRAFSHGCIRVHEPVKLADFVFKNNPDWDGERVQKQIDSAETTSVAMKEEMHVYITYFTAWVEPDGFVEFPHDIYNRDERLVTALK